MKFVNKLDEAWRILDRITGEISPGCGCLGRSGRPGDHVKEASAMSKVEAAALLNDITAAAEYIRRKLEL